MNTGQRWYDRSRGFAYMSRRKLKFTSIQLDYLHGGGRVTMQDGASWEMHRGWHVDGTWYEDEIVQIVCDKFAGEPVTDTTVRFNRILR